MVSYSPGLLSLGPNLFGELDIPGRTGRQCQTVADVHTDADTVGGLQQPQAVQPGAAIEDVLHGMWRPDRQDGVGTTRGIIVDQDCSAGLPDRDVRPDPDAIDRDGLGATFPQ